MFFFFLANDDVLTIKDETSKLNSLANGGKIKEQDVPLHKGAFFQFLFR
jgi:hypothetical protein